MEKARFRRYLRGGELERVERGVRGVQLVLGRLLALRELKRVWLVLMLRLCILRGGVTRGRGRFPYVPPFFFPRRNDNLTTNGA